MRRWSQKSTLFSSLRLLTSLKRALFCWDSVSTFVVVKLSSFFFYSKITRILQWQTKNQMQKQNNRQGKANLFGDFIRSTFCSAQNKMRKKRNCVATIHTLQWISTGRDKNSPTRKTNAESEWMRFSLRSIIERITNEVSLISGALITALNCHINCI